MKPCQTQPVSRQTAEDVIQASKLVKSGKSFFDVIKSFPAERQEQLMSVIKQTAANRGYISEDNEIPIKKLRLALMWTAIPIVIDKLNKKMKGAKTIKIPANDLPVPDFSKTSLKHKVPKGIQEVTPKKLAQSLLMLFIFVSCLTLGDNTSFAGGVTYPVEGTQFTVTVHTQRIKKDRDSNTYFNRYMYILNFFPKPEHRNIPRIEYVGYRVKTGYNVKHYQIMANGSILPLTDASQALYYPSRIVTNPRSYHSYPLLTKFVAPSECELEGDQVDFIAGYGFLTPEDEKLIQDQQAAQERAMQMNLPIQVLDKETMQLSIGQGNMLRQENYSTILTLRNECSQKDDRGGR